MAGKSADLRQRCSDLGAHPAMKPLWLAVWMATRWDCPAVIGRFIPAQARPFMCKSVQDRGMLLAPQRAVAEKAALEHYPDAILCEIRGLRHECKAITARQVLEIEP